MATLFVITGLALVGLPLFNGFIGEFLVLSSTFTGVSIGWAVTGTVGVILSAAYLLTLVQKVFYGPQSDMVSKAPVLDLNGLEQLNLWPLAILMFVMGVAPNYWLGAIETSAKVSSERSESALRANIQFMSQHVLTVRPSRDGSGAPGGQQ